MMKTENAVPVITKSELSKVRDNLLNTDQLNLLFQPTPKAHKYERPAKGGGKWTYVTGAYVKKMLNLLFGWNWSFEIIAHEVSIEFKQVVVKGKLTVRTGELGTEISRMQFGRQDVKFRKQTEEMVKLKLPQVPLDLGNDLKGATTDCLKKCASEFGIASDVYAPNEYKQIQIIEDPEPRDLAELTELVKNATTIDELQMLWDGLTADEKKIATVVVNLKKADIKADK